MRYYSTNRNAPLADFRDALLRSQPPDRGLYFPERIPVFSKSFVEHLHQIDKVEMGLAVVQPYVGDTMTEEKLAVIIRETLDFSIPLRQLDDDLFVLELFHGPTLAFKDVGARFMSRCLGQFMQESGQKAVVLAATSGDTGGAVASGFLGVEGVEVVLLYPSGKVSPVQEWQLTRLGGNVHALEVKGNFDDCQRMVKEAFADSALCSERLLTSANSINVARWLPQQLYYLLALQQWTKEAPPVIAVPSGNFGNLAAGLLAQASGLPVHRFLAACNVNDAVPRFLASGAYQPQPARPTLSNAMDVGDPSNFVRLQEIVQLQNKKAADLVSGRTVSDEETVQAMEALYRNYNYVADPHGAVAYTALKQHLQPGTAGIFLETAHPVKFPEAVEAVIGQSLELPRSVAVLQDREKKSTQIQNSYADLRDFLLDEIR